MEFWLWVYAVGIVVSFVVLCVVCIYAAYQYPGRVEASEIRDTIFMCFVLGVIWPAAIPILMFIVFSEYLAEKLNARKDLNETSAHDGRPKSKAGYRSLGRRT